MKLSKGNIAIGVILLVLIIDQIVKIWIKTNMYLGEDFEVFPWFHIRFIENNGMAFGMEIISKLFLSVFRIVAVTFIGYYLYKLIKQGTHKTGFIVCIALILAGAAGNIIDSLFYGLIFNETQYFGDVATMFPDGGGYAPIFYGKVVDMLYFPLFSFYWPDWIPFIGGNEFEFFRPIFNIADSAITVGVIILLLFYRKYLSTDEENKSKDVKASA